MQKKEAKLDRSKIKRMLKKLLTKEITSAFWLMDFYFPIFLKLISMNRYEY